MTPVIALIGQPNVGKSTLFNALTKTRDALVVNQPGVTRDRQYGEFLVEDRKFIVVDTGGLSGEREGIDVLMAEQVTAAMQEADMVVFLVDGRQGLTSGDEEIAEYVRGLNKPHMLVVNKTDGIDENIACGDFYPLGLGEPFPIAASHRRGVTALRAHIAEQLHADKIDPVAEGEHVGIKVAFIGRPNVGKSTLTNRLLGESRMVVCDMPGTTRDSVAVPFERRGQHYTLIDTAGVRRRGKVKQTVEKFSVVKALQTIESVDVVISVMDAREGITDQDLHILQYAHDAGRAMVLAINKCDGLTEDQKVKLQRDIDRRLGFVSDFVDVHFISALHGTNIGHLFKSIHAAYDSAGRQMSTSELTRVLEQAVLDHQPPLVKGRRVKLRYAHAGGHYPPIIVVHGKQTDALPGSYKRYLMQYFRKAFKLVGTPVKVELRTDDNPYATRK